MFVACRRHRRPIAGCRQRGADGDQSDRDPLHLADGLTKDQPRKQDRDHAEGRGEHHGDMGRGAVRPDQERQIPQRVEPALQADERQPVAGDGEPRPLYDKDAAEEDEARTLLGMLDEAQRREAVFEPRSNATVTPDTWQTWNASDGLWWSTRNPATCASWSSGTGSIASPQPWSWVLARADP